MVLNTISRTSVTSNLSIESLPLPNKDGEIWLRLFEDDGSRSQQNNSGGSSMDDAIPF